MSDSNNAASEPVGCVPVSIERDEEGRIAITWSDDVTTSYTAAQLRKGCPCASCREKKRGDDAKSEAGKPGAFLPVLSAEEAKPIAVEGMSPVGSYAYQINFSDGHSSGIFTFAILRDLEKR